MAPHIASTEDLFAVCADRYPEPVARAVSNVLFWSQFAQNYLRGHLGIYKTDAELAADLRKHHKTIGRLLRKVCAPAGKEGPDTLLVMRYGPKPGAHSGRVRWLFRTELGDQMIAAAQALAGERRRRKNREQDAVSEGYQIVRSATPKRSCRSPQNAPTPINQKNLSETPSEALSEVQGQREKPSSYLAKKEIREEVKRIERVWNAVCVECKEPALASLPGDIQRLAPRLAEVIHHLRLAELSDEELSKRFRLLCGEKSIIVFHRLGPAFCRFNPHGLVIDTFAKFGPRVWRSVEESLEAERRASAFKCDF